MQLLDHTQRRETRTAARGQGLEPPALLRADVSAGDIEIERDAGCACELHQHRLLNRVLSRPALDVRNDSLGGWEVAEPEREIQERKPIVEEGATARFDAPSAPPHFRALLMVRAGAYSGQLSQLAAAQEARERLNVAAKAMVIGHEHLASRAGRRIHDALHPLCRQGKGSFHEDVHASRDRTQHMRLVQMIGRRQNDRLQPAHLEQVSDVGVHVGNIEAVGERACLGPVVVAHGNQLDSTHPG